MLFDCVKLKKATNRDAVMEVVADLREYRFKRNIRQRTTKPGLWSCNMTYLSSDEVWGAISIVFVDTKTVNVKPDATPFGRFMSQIVLNALALSLDGKLVHSESRDSREPKANLFQDLREFLIENERLKPAELQNVLETSCPSEFWL